MKRIIFLFLLIAFPVFGQSTNDRPVMVSTNNTLRSYVTGANLPLTNLNISIFITDDFGWEDLRFPATAAAKDNPSADLVLDPIDNAVIYKTTSSTNFIDEHTYYVAQFPHAWRIGSVVTPHVHFLQDNSDQTNTWYMYYRWIELGATNETWSFLGPGTNIFTYTAGTMHQLATFGHVDGTGKSESSIMDVKIMRDGAAGTGNMKLKEFDIHYQIQKPTGEKNGF